MTAEGGTFSVSAEVAAADGAFEGYVKPLLDHAEFVSAEDFRERPLGAAWDTVVGALSEVFENQPHDRLATRVPVSGEFGPEIAIWPAIGGVIGNMFDALLEGVEDSVDLGDALQRDTGGQSGEADSAGTQADDDSAEPASTAPDAESDSSK